MKKLILILCCILGLQAAKAQDNNVGVSKWTIGFSLDVIDQHTPAVDGWQLFKAPQDFGFRVHGWYNPNSSVAIELGLSTGGWRIGELVSPQTEKNLHMFNGDVGIVYKFNNGYIFKESAPVAPFIFARARSTIMQYKKQGALGANYGFGIPIGGGLNFRVRDMMAFQMSAAYTFGITDNYDNNIIYSFGASFDIGPKPVRDMDGDGIEDEDDDCPMIPGVPELNGCPDKDMDGITDASDECPDVWGLAAFNGCPDTDGDGIADKNDDCPEVAGLEKFNGCPDTDGDGLRDIDDECPTVAGLPEFNGCPDPDRDGDGIMNDDDDCPDVAGPASTKGCPDQDGDGVKDSADKCPTEAGPASNKGCPEVKEEVIKQLEYAAQNIQFETGSAVLKTTSFKILDDVVRILNEWPNYSVSVEGHTDAVGSEESNQILSENRAKSAATYLVSKGIAEGRVTSSGFGESKPKADNGTAAGRAQNRRVEFNLFIP